LEYKVLTDYDFPSQLIVKKWGSESREIETIQKITMKKEANFENEKHQKFTEEKLLTHLDDDTKQIIKKNFADSNNSRQSESLEIINKVQTEQILDDFQKEIKI
jgi:hypothetical protein